MSKKRNLLGFLGPANDEPTTHHIIPRSRGGQDQDTNICIVPDSKHKAYHYLFANMTPEEILKDLVINYWNGQWHWLLKVLPK